MWRVFFIHTIMPHRYVRHDHICLPTIVHQVRRRLTRGPLIQNGDVRATNKLLSAVAGTAVNTFQVDESDRALSDRPSLLRSATTKLSTSGVGAVLSSDHGALPSLRMYQPLSMTANASVQAIPIEVTEVNIANPLVRWGEKNERAAAP
jgi:hypothetical protein